MSKQVKITATHKNVAAIVTESTAVLRKSEEALKRATQKVETQSASFVQQLVDAGARSADFKAGTASSTVVYECYKDAVLAGQSAADQKTFAKTKGEPKRAVIQKVGARMGAICKALARREALKAGTAVDKRTKAGKLAKAKTAAGKDSQTGNVSTDTEIESGTATEAKSSVLPPQIRDPRLVKMLNTVAQYDLSGQARFVEIMAVAIEAYNKEPAPTIESSLGLKK